MIADHPAEWAEDFYDLRPSFPKTVRNTWSNAAYLFAAAWCAQYGASGIIVAAALVMLAVGSAWWHGARTTAGLTADRFAMHVVFAGLAWHSISPSALETPAAMLWIGLMAGFFCTIRGYVWLTGCIALYLGTALAMTLVDGHRLMVGASLVAFGLGYWCWYRDRQRDPRLGLWGHAIWHKLTALGIALLFTAKILR